jgi:hypothetical protein
MILRRDVSLFFLINVGRDVNERNCLDSGYSLPLVGELELASKLWRGGGDWGSSGLGRKVDRWIASCEGLRSQELSFISDPQLKFDRAKILLPDFFIEMQEVIAEGEKLSVEGHVVGELGRPRDRAALIDLALFRLRLSYSAWNARELPQEFRASVMGTAAENLPQGGAVYRLIYRVNQLPVSNAGDLVAELKAKIRMLSDRTGLSFWAFTRVLNPDMLEYQRMWLLEKRGC